MLALGFSPRPGVDDNHLVISWDDQVIHEAQASGLGLQNTSWQKSASHRPIATCRL